MIKENRIRLELYKNGAETDAYHLFFNLLPERDSKAVKILLDMIQFKGQDISIFLDGSWARNISSGTSTNLCNDIDLYFQGNRYELSSMQNMLWNARDENGFISLYLSVKYAIGRPVRKDDAPALSTFRLRPDRKNYRTIDVMFKNKLPRTISDNLPVLWDLREDISCNLTTGYHNNYF